MLRIPSITLGSSAVLVGAVIIGAYVIFGGPSDIRKKKKKKDYVPGLANIGNSCFLNALVQALASCPLFVLWLKNKHKNPSPPLVAALHNLLKVLNDDDDSKGDACAGEVLFALRGHGWVISTEEQDAHEFFHALTATIDDELANAISMPSLLDIAWMETGSMNASLPVSNSGVVLRSDCWRYSDDEDCGKLKSINYFEADVEASSRIKKIDSKSENVIESDDQFSSSIVNGICNENTDFNSKLNDENKENVCGLPITNGDINETGNFTDQILNDKITSYPHQRVDFMIESGCDNEGCDITNPHADCSASPSSKNCEIVEKNYTEAAASGSSFNMENKIINNNLSMSAKSYNTVVISSADSHNSYSCIESISVSKLSEIDACDKEDVNDNENVLCVNESKHNEVTIVKEDIDFKQEVNAVPWKSHNDNQDSPFRGYLVSQLQCTMCGYRNPAQWTTFESLSLSLPSLPWGEVTIQGLLDSYISQERVTDVTCDACTKRAGTNVKTAFTKQLTIGKLPSSLCFHIKRTVWMDNGSAVKRQDHVIFPEFLTMDPYTYITSVNNQEFQSRLLGGKEANILPQNSSNISSSIVGSCSSSTEVEGSQLFCVARLRCEHLYRLKAVIVHVGDAFRGHFVTYRRGAVGTLSRNKWFYTSDLTVRETFLDDVRKANAYMILYEKLSE